MTPLVVVGAGPVGLSLALALARRGIDVRVLEAGDALGTEARASTLHPPTLEMFRSWGVADALMPLGRRVDELQFWERQSRQLVARFDYRLLAGDTPYPFRFQCPQDRVTRVLLEALLATGRARVDFGCRALEARDAGDHAVLAVVGPNGPEIIRTDWLVAADGSRSAIRESLGLDFAGITYVDRFLLCATDLDLTARFAGLGPVAYVFDPDEWVILMQQPELLRVVFRLRQDEDEAAAKAEAAVRARIAGFVGADLPYRLVSTSVYSVHQRVADRFRVGRVLLAGDAAHVNNPTGGFGMNSGVHDAWVLADRLGRVLDGGSEALLDDYAESRAAAARLAVQRDSDEHYRALSARGAGERQARNRQLAAQAADPVAARQLLLRMSMLESAPRPPRTAPAECLSVRA